MKKTLAAVLSAVLLIHVLPLYFLGFSFIHLGDAIKVSTSLSAKLACSGRYITGLSEQQIIDDLSAYTPVVNLIEFEYDDKPKRVTANLKGLAPTSATFRPNLGCTLDLGNQNMLNQITTPAITKIDLPLAINKKTQNVVDSLLEQDESDNQKTRALVVIKNGKIIAEAYGQGISPDTPLLGWSMAKTITSTMLSRLEQQHRLNRQDKSLFEEWQATSNVTINVQHLLQMTSGLNFDETYAPGSDSTRMLFTEPSASSVPLSSRLGYEPGEHFSYSSGTTNLLSRLVHNKLGNNTQSSVNFLFNQLFSPLGITTATFEMDASGVFIGSSYLYASGRDWGKLGLLWLNNGMAHDKQLLPQNWVKDATTPNTSANDKAYGYQVWLNKGNEQLRWPELPEDAYAMMGNRKQSVMMIPSQNVVLVRLGWSKGSYPMADNYRKILDSL